MSKIKNSIIAILTGALVGGCASQSPKKGSNLKTEQQYSERAKEIYTHKYSFDSTLYDENSAMKRFSNIPSDTLNKYFPVGNSPYSKLAFAVDSLYAGTPEYKKKIEHANSFFQPTMLNHLYNIFENPTWKKQDSKDSLEKKLK